MWCFTVLEYNKKTIILKKQISDVCQSNDLLKTAVTKEL